MLSAESETFSLQDPNKWTNCLGTKTFRQAMLFQINDDMNKIMLSLARMFAARSALNSLDSLRRAV